MKATITERAFLARMKRNLAKDGLTLCCPRHGTLAHHNLGPFYTVNERNVVESYGADCYTLLEWAREGGVLKPHETIEGWEEFEKGRIDGRK